MKKLFIVILVSIFLGGCASTKYIGVPVDKVRIEYRDRTSIDTLIMSDSTLIRERGDTVFSEKYKYLYRIREIKDTINTTDTITTVKTVEVTKEVNKIYNWQMILMVLGGVAVALGLYKLIMLIKKWI